jgi:hypothetical protein
MRLAPDISAGWQRDCHSMTTSDHKALEED